MQRKFSINIGQPYIENNFHIITCKNQMMDFYKKKFIDLRIEPTLHEHVVIMIS